MLPHEHRAARVSRSSVPGPVMCRSPRRRTGPPVSAVTSVGLTGLSPVEVIGWVRKAPVGQRATTLTTSSGSAASGRIQGRRLRSNTAGSPRRHSAAWRQRTPSKLTSTAVPWYRLRVGLFSGVRSGICRCICRKVEGAPKVTGDQVEVLVAMTRDEATYEWAKRQHRQPCGARLR